MSDEQTLTQTTAKHTPSKPDGGQAFPGIDFYDEKPFGASSGMSLRDYFAAQALAGLITRTTAFSYINQLTAIAEHHGTTQDAILARGCYELADAMIAERNQ